MGTIRTAVKGVDPGESGQATSTQRLHPLSQALSPCASRNSSFLIWQRPVIHLLASVTGRHVAGRGQKKDFKSQSQGVRQREAESSGVWCGVVRARENNRLETSSGDRC